MIYHHKITSDTQTKHRWELIGYWKSLYFMLSLNLFSESISLNARSRAVCSNERHIPSLLLPYQRAAAVNDRVKWPFLHVECQVIFSWVMIDRWKNSFKEKKVGVIHQKMCIWPIKHLQNTEKHNFLHYRNKKDLQMGILRLQTSFNDRIWPKESLHYDISEQNGVLEVL